MQTALVIFYSKIKGGSQVDFFAPQILLGTDMVDADIVALRENYAMRASELEEMYREREQENARAVVAAWEERDRALASATDLSDELSRVRIEADRTRRELSRTRGDSCDSVRAELFTCTSLLERSTELLERGAREYQELAIDHDAVVRMTK